MMNRKLWVTLGTLLLIELTSGLQRQPPKYYSQDMMPDTSFSCRDKIIGGYYADPETDCQMFHVCVKVPGQGVQDYKFLCPNDTAFDQENQICDDWFNIDCEASTLYYSDNFDLYRIGSDIPRQNQEPRLPNNFINNAVSENDDDSDLFRGSHSSNFFTNKNRGREDVDDIKEDFHSKNANRNGARKLLTGKRLVSTTLAPVPSQSTQNQQYQPRTHNFNSGRVSQFRGHQRNQQTSVSTEAPIQQTQTYNRQPYQQRSFYTTSTEIPTRQTETYSRQPFQQRSYYTPTTPKLEVTSVTQTPDFFRTYSSTTKRNYYENTQNYNAQTTTVVPRTTRGYQTLRTTSTAQPSTVFFETTTNSEKNNLYETQKLFKINTGGSFSQLEEEEDELFKTAHSQNLGASVLNSLQNSYKGINTSVSSSYNFKPTVKPTTLNFQTQTYQTTLAPTYYTQSTAKPFQQQNYFSTSKVQPSQQAYQQNYFNPSTSVNGVTNAPPQYTPTTFAPYRQTYAQPTGTTFQQYNPTTQKQQFNQNSNRPFQQQQTFSNPSPQQSYQQNLTPQQQISQKQNYQQETLQQQNYQKPTLQRHNYQPNTASQSQVTNFQPQRNSDTSQTYQAVSQTSQAKQQNQLPQRNTPNLRQTTNYYNPVTQRTYQQSQTTFISRGREVTLDTTEQPRPFTQPAKKDEKKEKEQYDYAYYDDGTQSEYDSLEPLEEFKRTKSKN